MASIFKRGSTWWALYRVNGRRVRESLGTRDEAKARNALKAKIGDAARLRAAKRMGLDVPEDPRAERVSLERLLEKYREAYLVAGGAALRESRLRSWKGDIAQIESLIRFFTSRGATLAARVSLRDVEAYRDWRASQKIGKGEDAHGISGATVNKALRVGRAMWGFAVRAGYAKVNPFRGVKPIKLAQYEPRNLTPLEVAKVLKGAGDLRALVAVAVYAGLRLGELVSLEWADVDLEGGAIRVRCDETFQTKSRKPRAVPIAPELEAILKPLARPAGLCFPDAEGKPRKGAAVSKAVTAVGKRTGVPLTPHDLRRTFASLLAARGVPTTRIRDYLGHASLATTEGYYLARGQFNAADVAGLAFAPATKPATPREETA